jgi:hypothetical protein
VGVAAQESWRARLVPHAKFKEDCAAEGEAWQRLARVSGGRWAVERSAGRRMERSEGNNKNEKNEMFVMKR